MADQETKDAIQSTALAVVEQQQTIVGGALVGASGAAALTDGGSQSQFDILEQLRDLQLRAVRGISEVSYKVSRNTDVEKSQIHRTGIESQSYPSKGHSEIQYYEQINYRVYVVSCQ